MGHQLNSKKGSARLKHLIFDFETAPTISPADWFYSAILGSYPWALFGSFCHSLWTYSMLACNPQSGEQHINPASFPPLSKTGSN
jgi:hypothetical protein